MYLTSTQIRTKAEEIAQKMSALINNPGVISASDLSTFDQLEKEYNELKSQSRHLKTVHDAKNFAPIDNTWTADQLKVAERLALTCYLRTGTLPVELKDLMAPSARSAHQSTSNGSGGYTIPQGFINDLERAMRDYGGIWESARIVKTNRGSHTPWPTTNDTDNKAYIIGESQDVTTDAEPVVFESKEFNGYKYTSGLIQVSNELLTDSELFADEFINVLAERFYRGANEHMTTGDGNNKPKGATVSAVLGRSTEAPGAISSADILQFIHSIDPAYRKRARFMMHDTVALAIELLATSTSENRPLWLPPQKEGGSPTLFGYPISINQNMTSFAGDGTADANKRVMLFGDFKKYIIRQARDMRIVRLPTRYADLDQTAFVVFMRVDGDIINAGTDPIKYMRVSAT